jgi:hypothetical protein
VKPRLRAQTDEAAYCVSLEALLRGVGLRATSTQAEAAAVGALRDPAGVNTGNVLAGREGRPPRKAAAQGANSLRTLAAKEAVSDDVYGDEDEDAASDAEAAAGGAGGAGGAAGGASSRAAGGQAGAAAGGQ